MRIVHQLRSEPTPEFLSAIQQHKLHLLKAARNIVSYNDDSCSIHEERSSDGLSLEPKASFMAKRKRLETTTIPSSILVLIKQIQIDLINIGKESIAQLHRTNEIKVQRSICKSEGDQPKQSQITGKGRNEEVALYISHFVAVLETWLEEVQETITIGKLRQIIQFFEGISRQLIAKAYRSQKLTAKELTPTMNTLFEAITNCFQAIQSTHCRGDPEIAGELESCFVTFSNHLKEVLLVYELSKLSKSGLIH